MYRRDSLEREMTRDRQRRENHQTCQPDALLISSNLQVRHPHEGGTEGGEIQEDEDINTQTG